VFILDSLLIDGLGFVFDKIRVAAEAEQDDDTHLREALASAQALLEAGELTEAEYALRERDILERLGAMRRRKQGGGDAFGSRVAGVEVEFTGEPLAADDRPDARPPAPRRARRRQRPASR
jgi:hypothetical protein